jgi:trehalose 6-phosphate phosphatase
MPGTPPAFEAAPFFARLCRAGRRALLIDYDGTLAPFRPRREEAVPYPGAREALQAVMDGGTRLVVVTGRSAASLLPLLAIAPPPEIWGSHGLERRLPDGTYRVQARPPEAERFLATAERRFGPRGGEVYEWKPLGFALHRRADPAGYERLRREAMELWNQSGTNSRLELLEFDGGVEFRPAGRHKGDVVASVLEEEGPGALAAYLGDDQTDEDAFRAIQGRGLGLLVREDPRPSAAEAWIHPPEELLRFLHAWAKATAMGTGAAAGGESPG